MTYTAISFDTQSVMTNSYDFDGGVLAQLKQFRAGPVRVVVSSVVAREIEKHLITATFKARKRLADAVRDATRYGIETGCDVVSKEDVETTARQRLLKFFDDIGARIIPTESVEIEEVLECYFNGSPPFSAGKKSEFPDAIALLSLAEFADSDFQTIVAASGDGDWVKFAANEQWIDVVPTLAEAIAAIQPNLAATIEDMRRFLDDITADSDSGAYKKMFSALEDEYTSESWGFEVEAEGFDAQVATADVELSAFSIAEDAKSDFLILHNALNYSAIQIAVDIELMVTAEVAICIGGTRIGEDTINRDDLVTVYCILEVFRDGKTGAIEQLKISNTETDLIVNLGTVDDHIDINDYL